jgi:hypothetical protein
MKKIFFLILFEFIIIFGFSQLANAYQISNLSDLEGRKDIVLSPSKMEIFLKPAESTNREIVITNQTGETLNFTIDIEDFKGSRDPNETVIFLEGEKGPYSLRDWLKPEIKEFTLNHGQRIHLPIQISVPPDAKAGGRYGVVFASAKPNTKEENRNGETIVSRVGTLFFVRINGEVKEEGFLKELKTPKKYYEKGPISFQLFFENNGNVHLNPYGIIEIFNSSGKKVGEMEVDPYFALPDSLRLREVVWNKGLSFGKYKALASINRGYQDIVDQKSTEFWVIPWKIILAGVVGFFLSILFLCSIFKMINQKVLKIIIILSLLVELSFLPLIIDAQQMTSTNYKILDSSINVGGLGVSQTSTSYRLRETIGEIATGISTSTSFKLHAGYQEMQEAYISLSVSTSSVTLLPEINVNLGQNTATGTFSATTITDNPAGYSLYIRATSSPALQSGSNSFADYTPSASGIPDYNWSIPATTSEFGFTPEGTQIVQKYKDNGVDTCNTGTNDTSDRCWYNFSTSDETISKSLLANHPSGTQTTIKLKAESGSQDILAPGTYQGTIIVTAITN